MVYLTALLPSYIWREIGRYLPHQTVLMLVTRSKFMARVVFNGIYWEGVFRLLWIHPSITMPLDVIRYRPSRMNALIPRVPVSFDTVVLICNIGWLPWVRIHTDCTLPSYPHGTQIIGAGRIYAGQLMPVTIIFKKCNPVDRFIKMKDVILKKSIISAPIVVMENVKMALITINADSVILNGCRTSTKSPVNIGHSRVGSQQLRWNGLLDKRLRDVSLVNCLFKTVTIELLDGIGHLESNEIDTLKVYSTGSYLELANNLIGGYVEVEQTAARRNWIHCYANQCKTLRTDINTILEMGGKITHITGTVDKTGRVTETVYNDITREEKAKRQRIC